MSKQEKKEKLGGIPRLFYNSRRLLILALRERPYSVTGLLIVSIVTATIPFLQSGLVALIINKLIDTTGGTALVVLISILVAVSVLPDLLSNIYNYLERRSWIGIMNFMELLFARRQADLDVSDLEDPVFRDTAQRAEENFYSTINLLFSQFDIVRNIVSLVVASLVILSFSPLIFIVVIAGIVPSFFVEFFYGTGEWGIWSAKSEQRRRFFDLRYRFLQVPEIVELKIFQNADLLWGKMKKLLADFEKDQISNETKKFLGGLVTFVISIFSIGFAIVWAIRSASFGVIEVGTMTFVLYAITNFSNSFSAFVHTVARSLKFSLYVGDIFSVLDKKSEQSKPLQFLPLEKIVPDIVFDHVSFKYPKTDDYVLKDFCLTIKAKERLALIGVNGAGKTTLVKLLCRFYDPTEGRILINGKDLKDIDLQEWYKLLAVLSQDYSTYHFLVRESIAMGDSSYPENIDEVKKAAELSDSHLFIEEWEQKYNQMVGKEFTGGVDPSRGQKQKLALARSFYRNPRVLILDEPTASVDAEAEAKIFEGLEKMPREQTMILISHRFSTVRNADKICVIENGMVSELGSHEELLKNNKTYKRLFEKQARGYR